MLEIVHIFPSLTPFIFRDLSLLTNVIWSSIPPISTKITYDVGIRGPWMGEAWKCGGDKPVNGIRTLPT
jgi:hypothetical protein